MLAAFPLMKENINSITIIIAAFFVLLNTIIFKKTLMFNKQLLLFTLIFWLFFFHEFLTMDFNIKRVLLHLPFLVFPVLFHFKPDYLDKTIMEISIIVFQGSVSLASCCYLVHFLGEYNVDKLFFIDKYNIPLFRDFIFRNSPLHIHPTYFSSFLLVSFTVSAYKTLRKKTNLKFTLVNVFNVVFTTFMIFLFSSRIIILLLFITIFALLLLFLKSFNEKKIWFYSILISLFIIMTLLPFKQILSQRFNEVLTDYKRPVKENYHNSTNMRIAILKCSFVLMENLPLFGYGDELQSNLNFCYENSFNSNFSKNKNYNTHNYYLNLVLYGGWFFVLFFLSYIILVIRKIRGSTLALLLLFQLLIVNLSENYLSRHYGIVTFNYFICLLYFFSDEKISFLNAGVKN
ncbi:O-antigen ligase family protein [Flavivirga abyssicola]|uniref:O-antigen ligase family protein n=1 Tax=Flavivirga abyssicola TaxID=3063533 RepID=UPI0038CC05D5